MPIVNTLAFLFTILGEWWVENKVISRGRFLPAPIPVPSVGADILANRNHGRSDVVVERHWALCLQQVVKPCVSGFCHLCFACFDVLVPFFRSPSLSGSLDKNVERNMYPFIILFMPL